MSFVAWCTVYEVWGEGAGLVTGRAGLFIFVYCTSQFKRYQLMLSIFCATSNTFDQI